MVTTYLCMAHDLRLVFTFQRIGKKNFHDMQALYQFEIIVSMNEVLLGITILLLVCQVCGDVHDTITVLSSCYKAFQPTEPKITLSDSLQKSLPISVLEHSARQPGIVFSFLRPILLFNRNSGPGARSQDWLSAQMEFHK